MRILYIIAGMLLSSVFLTECIEINPEDTNNQAVAHFILNRTIFEDGEKIAFQNRSINAESYKWEFGDGETSENENPVKAFHLPEGKHYNDYPVTLTATGTDGSTNAYSKTLHIGKRWLTSITLISISFTDSLGASLDSDNLLDLYLHYGLQSNPDSHAIAPGRSTPTRNNISQDAFPLIFNFPDQSNYIMEDTTWFLRIYEEDAEETYKIADFAFNPHQKGSKTMDGTAGEFILENDNCTAKLGFIVKTSKNE